MMGVSLLAPALLALAGLAIPIIAMYVLKMRRPAVFVSAAFLWGPLIQDTQANAPWQRLKRQPLLFLQLATLLLLVVALARPAILVTRPTLGEVAVLLDGSASMLASDVAPSRFDAARAKAGELIERLTPGDRMTLIQVGSQPLVLVPPTDDKGALKQGLANSTAAAETADLNAALDLAIAAARHPEQQHIYLISDGAQEFPERTIPGQFEYLAVGGGGDNAGISQIGLRETATGPQVYAELRNYDARPRSFRVVLSSDIGLVDARQGTLRGGEAGAITFETVPPNVSWLRIEIPEGDSLAIDNRAWLTRGVGAGTERVLLVSKNGVFLERALKLLPRVEVTRVEPGKEPATAFDLVVYDGVVPAQLPVANAFFVDPPSSTALFSVQGEIANPRPALRAQDDPLLRYTDLTQVQIQTARKVSAGDWARPLVGSGIDSLLSAGTQNGRRYAVLAFDLQKSDLPLQVSFPILMANLVDWLTVRPGGVSGYAPGDLVHLPLPASNAGVQRVEVIGPDGQRWQYGAERSEIAFAHTDLPGLYMMRTTLKDGQVIESRFAVNFLNVEKSQIRPNGKPPINGRVVVSPAATASTPEISDLWTPLAVLCLLLLLVEWLSFFGVRRRRAAVLAG